MNSKFYYFAVFQSNLLYLLIEVKPLIFMCACQDFAVVRNLILTSMILISSMSHRKSYMYGDLGSNIESLRQPNHEFRGIQPLSKVQINAI